MTKLLPLLFVVAACSKSNPYYCEGNPDDNCTIDASTTGDGSMACTMSSQCGTSAKPVCDEGQGVCVACTASEVGACSGTTPVCSAANQCRGCTANADCVSQACMPDGSCASPSAILYVSSTGGATNCVAEDKCSLEHAVSLADATRKVIVLDAAMHTTTGTVAISGKELTLLGRGAEIFKGGGTGPALNVTAGANVKVYYATIKNGADGSVGHGIACSTATVLAAFVTLQDNDANGINTTGCDVTLDRSTLTNNERGAISISGTSNPFSITNNFIYANGDASTSPIGGAKISVVTPSSSRFEFNTIVDNSTFSDPGNAGGVACSGTAAPANNIIARNYVGVDPNASNSQTFGGCVHASSKIQAAVTDLAFVDATGPSYDLRIGLASVAKDAATTASPITIDFEGDERPQNGVKDIGADEYK